MEMREIRASVDCLWFTLLQYETQYSLCVDCTLCPACLPLSRHCEVTLCEFALKAYLEQLVKRHIFTQLFGYTTCFLSPLLFSVFTLC